MWRYSNPVDIRFGAGEFDQLADLVRVPYCLVTYGEPAFDAIAQRAASLAGRPSATIRNIGPNPDFRTLAQSCASLNGRPVDAIVAIGGGSVMDAAKVLAAAGDDFSRVRTFLETGRGADQLRALPIIAVPTTAGTGSEVTCWATVWDTDAKKKYSLSRPSLYPAVALIDPLLTVDAPRDVTVSSGLDALSHALESIWNVHANPVSSALAETAAREAIDVLPRLAGDLRNVALRSRMAKAALMAGLAFSNTRTALAHSLSYHLTLHHGTPHGIACSFSLPMVMRGAIGVSRDCDAALQRIFGADLERGARQLEALLHGLGIATDVTQHGVAAEDWERLVDAAFAGDRGRNYIGRRELIGAGGPPLRSVAAR
ncbi:MAG TPA: iron-containing alcohol dehydrogenase PsrA [Alphaproteobacteria bacterium]|nr:iron-containing alcohol dehydrogenase PsrA [Alphaproteobacteria bacterium]